MSERSRPTGEGTEALDVLRTIWTAQRQSGADVEPPRPKAKVCKNMKNIGFGGLGGGDDLESTALPVGDDMRAAWRERLAREGKLRPGAGSLRDLVVGDS